MFIGSYVDDNDDDNDDDNNDDDDNDYDEDNSHNLMIGCKDVISTNDGWLD